VRTGMPSRLVELPIQYSDYAVWQREVLQGDVLEDEIAYWRSTLGERTPVLDLPTDFPRPASRSQFGSNALVILSHELSGAVRNLARGEGATLFVVLMAAFQALLSRYAGREDVLVGMPCSGRHRVETEALIGFFVNLLGVRTRFEPRMKFSKVLRGVKSAAMGAFAHQGVPLAM